MTYRVRFTCQAGKDIAKLTPRLKEIFRNRLAVDLYSGKLLVGPLQGYYSVRLSYQAQVVYRIYDEELLVVVLRARTHYGA